MRITLAAAALIMLCSTAASAPLPSYQDEATIELFNAHDCPDAKRGFEGAIRGTISRAQVEWLIHSPACTSEEAARAPARAAAQQRKAELAKHLAELQARPFNPEIVLRCFANNQAPDNVSIDLTDKIMTYNGIRIGIASVDDNTITSEEYTPGGLAAVLVTHGGSFVFVIDRRAATLTARATRIFGQPIKPGSAFDGMASTSSCERNQNGF